VVFKGNDGLFVKGKSVASSGLAPGKRIKQGKQHDQAGGTQVGYDHCDNPPRNGPIFGPTKAQT